MIPRSSGCSGRLVDLCVFARIFQKAIACDRCHGRRDAETVGTCDSMGAFYVRKGAGFWENLDAALVEIYPANLDRINLSGSRSTGLPAAFAGSAG
jgi:hypothetical protein